MQYRFVTFVTYIIATLISQAAGELVVTPRDTESKVGDTTYFNCSTNLESREIFWHHDDKYIYTGIGIHEPYHERFKIDRNASEGSHNLVIYSVQPEDSGQYICIDDDGIGIKRSAQLIVLVKGPTCQSSVQPDGVIGQNVFNIIPDEVQLTCNVSYHGNIPPQIQWKKLGNNNSTKDGIASHVGYDNRVIYTLKLKGDMSLDNSSYACQTTRATQNQYGCSSETIKVLYFVGGTEKEQTVVIGEKITCIAQNSTMPCTSQWYHDNYTCPLSCDETITTHVLGTYMCTVKCEVRGTDYFHETMKVSVVEATTPPPWLTSGKIVTAAVLPITIIVIMAALIAVLVILFKRKARMKFEKERLYYETQMKCEREKLLQEAQMISEKERLLQEAQLKSEREKLLQEAQMISEKERLLHEEQMKYEKERLIQVAQMKSKKERLLQEAHKISEKEKLFQEAQMIISEKRKLLASDNERDLEGYSKEYGTQQKRGLLMQPSKEMKVAKDEPILIRTINPEATFIGNAICGLTILGNELFILIMDYQEIEVFDLQNLRFGRKFSLKDHTIENPWDIQASSKFGCLYVVDNKTSEEEFADIIKIDPLGNVQKIWSTKFKVCRLSITREFNVIVTSLRHRNIREYSPYGDLIFEIALASYAGIVHPRVTLKQSNNEYIVSHGYRGDSQHIVCVIDREGKLIHQFGGRKGSTNEQLNLPVHMATYSDGRVLVADTENSRVVLLSSKLEFIEAFFLQSLRFPNRMCLDEQNKRLYISDNQYIKNIKPWTDGRILVYNMSNVQLT